MRQRERVIIEVQWELHMSPTQDVTYLITRWMITCQCLRRTHKPMATMNQAHVAVPNTIQGSYCGAHSQTRNPNTIIPTLPSAAPAASAAAACRPRRPPCFPRVDVLSFSCFSTSLRLAGKMAGKAKKSPPTAGPNFTAMAPAEAVMRPPKIKRWLNSRHLICLSAARLI